MEKKNLLGIFDSGIGGFSVFKEVRKSTTADIIYFGDCARAPYGNKSEEEIVGYIREILLMLKGRGVTHFISACNSMSVFTTKQLLKEVGIESVYYFDMVSAVETISFPTDKKVLIVGTKATITSGVYQQILESKDISYEVYSPVTLAGDIERGDTRAIVSVVSDVIRFAVSMHIDSVVYACTHYPLVSTVFEEEAKKNNWNGDFIDPAVYIGKHIEELNVQGNGNSSFETSLMTEAFTIYTQKYSK